MRALLARHATLLYLLGVAALLLGGCIALFADSRAVLCGGGFAAALGFITMGATHERAGA